jgi:hypothetical protein
LLGFLHTHNSSVCKAAGRKQPRHNHSQPHQLRPKAARHVQLAPSSSHSCPTLWPQVIPVLRAGLVLLEQTQQVLPAHETYHVGYVRDEETLLAR